jgi:hypothetical protein
MTLLVKSTRANFLVIFCVSLFFKLIIIFFEDLRLHFGKVL